MAKSRKSSKATDKKNNIAESSEEAEIVASEELSELVNEDDSARTSKQTEALEEGPESPAEILENTQAHVEETVEPLAEALEETDTDVDLDAIAKAEMELEESVLAEDEADLAALDGQSPEALEEEADPQDSDEVGDAEPTDEESTVSAEDRAEDSQDAKDILDAEVIDEAEKDPASEVVAETPEREPAESLAVPAPAPQVQQVSGSIWPGFFGGVIAALIGFIVGRGDMIDSFLPESFQRAGIDTSAIEALTDQNQQLAAQSATLGAQATDLAGEAASQSARIDALETAASAPPLVTPEMIAAIEAQIDGISTRLTELEARPTTLEPSDTVASTDEVAALESTLADQKAQLAELAARAEAAEARAADEAAQLLARAAVTRLVTAVDSGETFAPALSDLEQVAPVEVPDALREAAEAGVPTLAALQDSFPDAARAGLSAARAEVPESEVVGVTGFIRRQLNVRSVTPREGSDPDAVLSRAQAAVRAGDLDTALTEMEALPEAARAAMSDWLDAASARKAAQDAAGELSDSLNSN